jgi:hypothetical protein
MALSYESLKAQIEILAVDENQAGAMLGKKSIFKLMVDALWIAPICAEHSCVLYSVSDVKSAFAKWIRLGHKELVKQASEKSG